MDSEIQGKIQRAISSNDVILFMKGTRQAPSCGFSARTVEMLDSVLDDYAVVDVLAHPEIREGIKEFSSWPTIPQLYVRGEFVGGADIVQEMFESGALHQLFGVEVTAPTAPTIHLTERAVAALQGFLAGSSEVVLLEIDRSFAPRLSIGPLAESALCTSISGVTIAVDPFSAKRAEGITIDYIETAQGAAFKVDNPNEPPKVRPLSVTDLKAKLDRGEALRLIDVRTPGEWETARVANAELLDSDLMDELRELPKSSVLVFMCHHGHRSQRAASQFTAEGFSQVYNLSGGIDAWSQAVDPSVPRY